MKLHGNFDSASLFYSCHIISLLFIFISTNHSLFIHIISWVVVFTVTPTEILEKIKDTIQTWQRSISEGYSLVRIEHIMKKN